jgi:hypothetical protein
MVPGTRLRRASRVRAFLALIGVALAWQRAAGADGHRSATLHYVREPGAERCLEQERLEAEIAGRLGYAPFTDGAATRIDVRVEASGKGLRALIRFVAGSTPPRERVLDSPGTDCVELGASLALTIALAIDPVAATGAAPPPTAPAAATAPPVEPSAPRAMPTAPPKPAPEVPPVAAPAPPPPSWSLGFLAGATVGTGTLPAPTFGPSVAAEVALLRFAFGVEGRFDFPRTAEEDGSSRSVRAYAVRVSPLACLRIRPLLLCAVPSFGAVHGEGQGVEFPGSATTAWVAAGLRVGGDFFLTQRIWLRPTLEGQAVMTPTELRLNDREIWSSPPIAVSLGLALGIATGTPP